MAKYRDLIILFMPSEAERVRRHQRAMQGLIKLQAINKALSNQTLKNAITKTKSG